MVIVSCPSCGSLNITLDTEDDMKCLDCGYGAYIEDFDYKEYKEIEK